MPILELVMLLIVLVISSHVIGQVLPKIPVSIIQIALGVIVALTLNVSIKLETSWFLLLFIAPLLFNDAWRFQNVSSGSYGDQFWKCDYFSFNYDRGWWLFN